MTAGAEPAARQLPIAFPLRSSHAGRDFFVSRANEDAVTLLRAPADWPGPVLVLHGPEASGKSHLLDAWVAAQDAHAVTGDDLAAGVPEAVPACYALDRADAVIGDAVAEEALFHLINRLSPLKGRLLLTGRQPASAWRFHFPDLASRVRAGLSVAIEQPDDALLEAMLIKQFEDRQLEPSAGVIRYLMTRIERSGRAVTQAVARLDAESLSRRRPITIDFARLVLGL